MINPTIMQEKNKDGQSNRTNLPRFDNYYIQIPRIDYKFIMNKYKSD